MKKLEVAQLGISQGFQTFRVHFVDLYSGLIGQDASTPWPIFTGEAWCGFKWALHDCGKPKRGIALVIFNFYPAMICADNS